jgi:hypothetical protein
VAADRPEDVDEEFNRIVGGLGPGWSGGLAAWPDPPDAVDPAPGDTEEPPEQQPDAPAPRTPEPREEHFRPPPAPPLSRPEPVTALCWLLVLGAPVLLMLITLAGWYVPRWLLGAIALGFVGGVVTLVLRLDDRPRDTDDGAVV